MSVGERIKQVRELRGLTQGELGQIHGVDQSFVANIEASRKGAPDPLIRAIAFHSGFPTSFFHRAEVAAFSEGSLAFRSHSSIKKRERLQAYRSAELAFDLATMLITQVNPIPVSVPRLETGPVQAAAAFRAALGIAPDRPLANVVRAAEKLGVIVVRFRESWPGIFAFSVWAGDDQRLPVIFLTGGQSADRDRMNVGHELRHLTKTPKGTPREIEDDANEFAAELLLPRTTLRVLIRRPVTLNSLAELKPKWGLSIQALIRQAVRAELISERQYRYLNMQVNKRGWRREEPIEIAREYPRALPKMAEVSYGIPPDYRAISRDTSLPSAFIRKILETSSPSERVTATAPSLPA